MLRNEVGKKGKQDMVLNFSVLPGPRCACIIYIIKYINHELVL